MKSFIITIFISIAISFSLFSGLNAVTGVDTCPPNYDTVPGLLYQGPIYNDNGDVVGYFNGIICHAEDPTPNVYCCIKIKVQ